MSCNFSPTIIKLLTICDRLKHGISLPKVVPIYMCVWVCVRACVRACVCVYFFVCKSFLRKCQSEPFVFDRIKDILLNVFLAIAVDNLADADALGESDAKETPEVEVTYEVSHWTCSPTLCILLVSQIVMFVQYFNESNNPISKAAERFHVLLNSLFRVLSNFTSRSTYSLTYV